MGIALQLRRACTGLILLLAAGGAAAEVVVIVSVKNPCSSLSVEQANDLFLGNVANFPGGGGAVPLDQPEGSPQRTEFYGKVAGKSPAQLKAYWSKIIFTGKGRPPREAGDSAAVRKQVADGVNLVGYVERSAVDASVKVVLTVH